jgi:hypothetical protein
LGDALANAVATQNAVAEMPAARLFLLLTEGPEVRLSAAREGAGGEPSQALAGQNGAVALPEFPRYEYKYSS